MAAANISQCVDRSGSLEKEGNPAEVCACRELHKKSDCRNRMLIISAVVQWMLMLLCIIYLAILFHHSHKEEIPEKMYVFTTLSSQIMDVEQNKKLLLKFNMGNMDVNNGSIYITTDGHYLVYLEGCLNAKSDNNTITVWRKNEHNERMNLLREWTKNGCIRASMVKELKQSDEIYVEKDLLYQKFVNFTLFLHCIDYP